MNKKQLESLITGIDMLIAERLKPKNRDITFDSFQHVRDRIVEHLSPILCKEKYFVRTTDV